VTLSPSDHERLVPWEAQLTGSLAELVQEYLDENHWQTIGDGEVYLARDDEMHTGNFGVASRMDGQAPPRRRPHDSLSLPAVGANQPPPVPAYANAGGGGTAPAAALPPPVAPPSGRASVVVDQTNQIYELRRGSNVVGRGAEVDLQLLDQGVSRRHLDIQFDGHQATAYDLGSTNGTAVNGHEVGSHVLQHGDVIRVGHTRLVFHAFQQETRP
jgi:hypothetical protein